MYFRKNIKIALSRIGMTQNQLSDTLGIGQSTVSNWIKGTAYPQMDTLLKMREIVGIDLETLVYKDLSNDNDISFEMNVPNKMNNSNEMKITEGVLERMERRLTELEQEVTELKQILNNQKK